MPPVLGELCGGHNGVEYYFSRHLPWRTRCLRAGAVQGQVLGLGGAGSRQSRPTLHLLVLPAVLEGVGLAEQAGMWGEGGRTISPGDPGPGAYQPPDMRRRSQLRSPEPSSGPAPDAHATQRTLALSGSPSGKSALGGKSSQCPKGAWLSPGARGGGPWRGRNGTSSGVREI